MKKIFTLFASLFIALGAVAQTEEVEVYIEDYDGNEIAEPYKTTITRDADGNYVLGDILGSGGSLVFNFSFAKDEDETEMTFPTIKLDKDDSAWLKGADGKYLKGFLFGYGDEEVTKLSYLLLYGNGYSTVFIDDDSEDTPSYGAYVNLAATDDTGEWLDEDIYLVFYFHELETAAVSTVEAANDAPVQYYNLNGQRIENPSNGIFIRKQGNKTSKVVIR